MHGTTAVYRPYSGGRPASVAKAMPCGRTSSAPSTPAMRSARRLARSTRWIHDPKTRAASSFTALDYRARETGAAKRRTRRATARRRCAAAPADRAPIERRRSPWRRSARARASARRSGCRERRHRADAAVSAATTRSGVGLQVVERRADGAGRAGVLQGVADRARRHGADGEERLPSAIGELRVVVGAERRPRSASAPRPRATARRRRESSAHAAASDNASFTAVIRPAGVGCSRARSRALLGLDVAGGVGGAAGRRRSCRPPCAAAWRTGARRSGRGRGR